MADEAEQGARAPPRRFVAPHGDQKRCHRRVAPRRGGRGAATRPAACFILTILFFSNSTHMYSMVDDISCHVHIFDAIRRVLP